VKPTRSAKRKLWALPFMPPGRNAGAYGVHCV
jgi:hypothetical protein